MPDLPWDRLMETCVKQDGDAVLISGISPLLRVKGGFRESLVSPLSTKDLEKMVERIGPAIEAQEDIAGCFRSFDIRYGSEYRFRLAVFDRNPLHLVVLTRVSAQAPPPLVGESKKWSAAGTPFTLDRIMMNCAKDNVRDAVLMVGCPPVAWSKLGAHAFLAPALTAEAVIAMHDELLQTARSIETKNGYATFDVPFRDGVAFRAAVFGNSMPWLIFLLKLAGEEQKGN